MEEKIIRALEVLDTYFPTFDGPTTLVSNYGKSMKKRKDMDSFCKRFGCHYVNIRTDKPLYKQLKIL